MPVAEGVTSCFPKENVESTLNERFHSLLFIKKYFQHCPIWFGSTWRNPLVPGTLLRFPYSVHFCLEEKVARVFVSQSLDLVIQNKSKRE